MLQRILQSPDFHASRRCHDFIQFVVEQSLAGLQDGLKERTIGVQVFGRPVTYDTNADGIVRIKASEVRKRLAAYYAGAGKEDSLRVELPVGSYVPHFYRLPPLAVEKPVEPLKEVEAVPAENPQIPRGILRRWAPGVLGLLVLGGVAFAWRSQKPSITDRFWGPVLQSKEPLLLAADYTPVYLLRPLREAGKPEPPVTVPDFILQTDQYLGGGDLVAAAKVSAMLGRQGQELNVRVGKGVSFEDLREAPCVLIGYSATRWSQLTKDFRYCFDENGMVRDQGRPTPWLARLTRDSHTDLDYAIISRANLPQTHACMILISGSTQYGTESAANLITTPELLEEAMRSAPKGWEKRNLQLVLQVKVIANAPGTPTIIASHFW